MPGLFPTFVINCSLFSPLNNPDQAYIRLDHVKQLLLELKQEIDILLP